MNFCLVFLLFLKLPNVAASIFESILFLALGTLKKCIVIVEADYSLENDFSLTAGTFVLGVGGRVISTCGILLGLSDLNCVAVIKTHNSLLIISYVDYSPKSSVTISLYLS